MRPTLLALASIVSVASALPALGQSVWAVNGPAAGAVNLAGPPAGACGDPTGPVIGGFPYLAAFGCPTAGPFPPPIAAGPATPGDIAVDRINDLVFITDGMVITGYTKAGVPVVSFPSPLPPPLTGLGWAAAMPVGPAGPSLWVTNGVLAAAVLYPIAGCVAAVPFSVPPFPVTFAGMCTDIDYDPMTATVFESNSMGPISNQTLAGAPGPFGVFGPGLACAFGGLQGIAVDTASCGALFVTSGVMMGRLAFGGGPVAPTFYAPMACWPAAGPMPHSGLGFDATPVRYATGCNNGGIGIPVADTIGEALTPQPGFAVRMTGGTPGAVALLVLGAAPACPRVPIGFGCAIATFPLITVIGPIGVPPGGTIVIPAPLPPGLGCTGATGYVQWIQAKTTGTIIGVSNALHLRPAVP